MPYRSLCNRTVEPVCDLKQDPLLQRDPVRLSLGNSSSTLNLLGLPPSLLLLALVVLSAFSSSSGPGVHILPPALAPSYPLRRLSCTIALALKPA